MGLINKDPEADRLARELAKVTGESVTDAVMSALRARFDLAMSLIVKKSPTPGLRDRIRAIRKRCAALPVLDDRSPEEIVGYDDRGLPR